MCSKYSLLTYTIVLAVLGASVVKSEVPTPNLLWWQFDEESGGIAEDASGNGRDGVISGAVRKSGGVGGVGGCLEFLGSGQTVEDVAAPDYLNGLEALTVALWIKSDAVGTDSGFIWFSVPDGGDNGGLRYDAASWKWEGGTNLIKMSVPGAGAYEGADATQTTEWQHLTMVWASGETMKLYIDGIEDVPRGVDDPSTGPLSGVATLLVGKGAKDDAENRSWDGMVDDVRIYDYGLTPEQIQELATTNLPAFLQAMDPEPANEAVGVQVPLFGWAAGDTGIFHDVYLGTTPDLTDADLVMPRSIMKMYYHPQSLEPGTTYYWRVDEIEADMTTVHTGRVWSFTTQALTAYLPTPADGSINAPLAPELAWLPGQGAIQHQVYFSDNFDDVNDAAAAADKGVLQETTFAPGDLDSLASYYWRVDEILLADEVRPGPVWSFATYRVVEDFESYTDDEGERIYEAWIDGWVNNTGSTVGYIDAPFAEQTIVNGGGQSMPLEYNNENQPFYSEAEYEWNTAQDWTADGIAAVVLFIRGQRSNDAAPLYVGLEDTSGSTGIVVHTDAEVVKKSTWTEWSIPLSDSAGVNLARVKKMYLGVGDRDNPTADGSGLIYIDDIRVTR